MREIVIDLEGCAGDLNASLASEVVEMVLDQLDIEYEYTDVSPDFRVVTVRLSEPNGGTAS